MRKRVSPHRGRSSSRHDDPWALIGRWLDSTDPSSTSCFVPSRYYCRRDAKTGREFRNFLEEFTRRRCRGHRCMSDDGQRKSDLLRPSAPCSRDHADPNPWLRRRYSSSRRALQSLIFTQSTETGTYRLPPSIDRPRREPQLRRDLDDRLSSEPETGDILQGGAQDIEKALEHLRGQGEHFHPGEARFGPGSKAGYTSGVAGVDARRVPTPEPRSPHWGLAGYFQLDPSHTALVTREGSESEP